MNDFSVTRLARLIEFLNPLAFLELGLAVQQEVNHPAFATAPGAESPWKIAWLLLWRVVEAGLEESSHRGILRCGNGRNH